MRLPRALAASGSSSLAGTVPRGMPTDRQWALTRVTAGARRNCAQCTQDAAGQSAQKWAARNLYHRGEGAYGRVGRRVGRMGRWERGGRMGRIGG